MEPVVAAVRRPLAVLDAPSNLGLRPPGPGLVPGVHKLAGALRDQGLVRRLAAGDAGVVVAPRYRPDWDGVHPRNADAVARYSRTLAGRIGRLLDAGTFPVVLGGDCSILLGGMLALRGRGRVGLVFVDGHSDFRHPGNAGANADAVQAVAGEDLAVVCGLAHPPLADLDGQGRLVAPPDVVAIGVRPDDDALAELSGLGVGVVTSDRVGTDGAAASAEGALRRLRERGVERFWIHVDADVVDPAILPAVDSPAPGGLDLTQLADLLAPLLAAPEAAGFELTVFDPDLDESGDQAARLTDALLAAFGAARSLAAAVEATRRRPRRPRSVSA
jgi:arginase